MKESSKYINTYCTGCGLCHSVQGTELKMIDGGFPNVDVKKGESLEFYHSVCHVFYGSFYHGRSAGKCQVYVGTVRGNGSIAAVCYHIGG